MDSLNKMPFQESLNFKFCQFCSNFKVQKLGIEPNLYSEPAMPSLNHSPKYYILHYMPIGIGIGKHAVQIIDRTNRYLHYNMD